MRGIIEDLTETDIGIVLVEHNVRFVFSLAHSVVVLDHGVVIANGTPEEVQQNPDVIRSYLGAPKPEVVLP